MADDPCPECGYPWDLNSDCLLDRLSAAPARWGALARLVDQPALRLRPAPATWSALEYLGHTRDAIRWYTGRIRSVLERPGTRLDAFDWDAAAEARRYNEEDLETVMSQLTEAFVELHDLLDHLDSGDWDAFGIGSSDGGQRSVLALARRALHEEDHHHLDVTRPLMGEPS